MMWILLCSLAFAGDEVVTLKKGEAAPYDGTLLSPSAAARLLAKGESDLATCLADAKKDKAILVIRNGLVNNSLVADAEINLSATMVELTTL